MELLTVDIEHEEARAGVCDLADPAYPVLARSLRTRRDDIGATIVSLQALAQGTPKASLVGVGADRAGTSRRSGLGQALQLRVVPKTKMVSLEGYVP